jgi:hypothetical protein
MGGPVAVSVAEECAAQGIHVALLCYCEGNLDGNFFQKYSILNFRTKSTRVLTCEIFGQAAIASTRLRSPGT